MVTPDASDIRQLRLLLKDRGEVPTWTDTDLSDFWEIEGGVLKRAGALALETAAQDEARALTCIKTTGIETNGLTAAQAIMLTAKEWRAQAIQDGSTGFVIVPLVHHRRERRLGY